MKYTDLSILKIHKMSQEQYEREKIAGNINENEIYLTPDDGVLDTSEFVRKYTVEINGYETVADFINKLITEYPDYQFGTWTMFSFTGAISALYGMTINHYGGNIYNISGIDFGTNYTMNNKVQDWSQINIWAFSEYFQPPIPNCSSENAGSFLMAKYNETNETVEPQWAELQDGEGNIIKDTYAKKEEIPVIPTKISAFENDTKYLTSYTESDPTVPAWAKTPNKPSYSKSEVGLGNVDNVKQYSASNPPPYPVTKINNKTGDVTLSASDVGADASGAANSAVNKLLRDSAFAPVPQLPANGQKVGDPLGGGGLVPDFESAIDLAKCTLNRRVSSSGTMKDADGDVSTDYITVTSLDTIYINRPLADLNTDYSRVKFYSGNATNGYSFISSADAKLGEQFTVTETDGVCSFKLSTYSSGLSSLGVMFTAIRIVLHISTAKITESDIADLVITVNDPITYTELDGEKATVAADFDGNNIKAQNIYDYMDKLVAKYPRLITKETMGKDASNTYDWCRYVFGRRAYDAWMRQNYPPMYAWVNGSTTIYSVSVSPRVGDTMYSTTYIGTAKGTVTAVSNANQSRTVGGVVYTRDKTKDVEPTLVYTETPYSAKYIGTYQGLKNEVSRDDNGVKTRVGSITAIDGDTMTCSDTRTYIRYPLGDRDEKYQLKPVILLGANEHGLETDKSGDASEPAIITARLAKDLCECDPRHAYLNMLRDGYKIVLVPIINPYGFTVGKYTNSNNVNIDRNFDTPGWGKDTVDTRHGAYGGSENETQYWMNTCVASKAIVGMANHSYGRKIDSSTGEIVVAGTCGCMIPRPNDVYNEDIERIEMNMAGNYNLSLIFSNSAEPEDYAKTRSYMDWVGIKCCALEMQVSEGFLLHDGGEMFTSRVMEANYTLLLQFLHMLLSEYD